MKIVRLSLAFGLLAFGISSAAEAPAPVLAAPTTGALFRPTAANFISGNGLLYSGGPLGTPSSGTLTNATGLPISTGVTGLGSGIAAFLATPSSANFAAALTTKTGTGSVVFSDSPTFTGALGISSTTSAAGFSIGVATTPHATLKTSADAAIALNRFTFSGDSSDGYKASPGYNAMFAADAWLVMSQYPGYFTNAQVKNAYKKFLAAVSGGNFPIALNTDGTANAFYSGFDSNHTHTGGDPIWCAPLLAKQYYDATGDTVGLAADLALMDAALQSVPRNGSTHLVSACNPAGTTSGNSWVPWGFQDGVHFTGDNLMGSLLCYAAETAIASLYTAVGNSAKASAYAADAALIAANIDTLYDAGSGMYLASSGQNNQIDINGSAYVVFLGLGSHAANVRSYLVANYGSLCNSSGYFRQSPIDWAVTQGSSYDSQWWSWGNQWILKAIYTNDRALAIALATRMSQSSNSVAEYYGGTANFDLAGGSANNMESPMGALKFLADLAPESSSAIYASPDGNTVLTGKTYVSSSLTAAGGVTTAVLNGTTSGGLTINSAGLLGTQVTSDVVLGTSGKTTNYLGLNRTATGAILESSSPALGIYNDGTNLIFQRYNGAGSPRGSFVLGDGGVFTVYDATPVSIFSVTNILATVRGALSVNGTTTGYPLTVRTASGLNLQVRNVGSRTTLQSANDGDTASTALGLLGSTITLGMDAGTALTVAANRSVSVDAGDLGVTAGNVTFATTGKGLALHGGGALTGASGALTLTASGTNQNITLTPSGSGVVVSNNLFSAAGQPLTLGTGTSGTALTIASASNNATFSGNLAFSGGDRTITGSSGDSRLSFVSNGSVDSFVFTGAAVSTTMKLVGPADNNYGGNLQLYSRDGTSQRVNILPVVGELRFNNIAGSTFAFQANGTDVLKVTGTAAATLTGGAGNMTILAGTGNSRTMTLQTTTSGGVATAFLTGNADQSATFGGTLTLPQNSLSGSDGTLRIGAADTPSYVALRRTAQRIDAILADASDYAGFKAKDIEAAGITAGAGTFSGALTTSSSTRSGPGAAPITTSLCKVTTTGVADALTLADGVDGQRITIVHDVDGGSFVLTPTTKTGWTTYTSTAAGETISLVFVNTRGWMVTGSYLGTIAP